jgi:uncharacterized membrane protein YdjX (TVP38/TMEM64 family)
MQNLFLATVCPRFWFYYGVSLPPVLLMALLYVNLGSTLTTDRWPLIMGAMIALAALALLLAIVRKNLAASPDRR